MATERRWSSRSVWSWAPAALVCDLRSIPPTGAETTDTEDHGRPADPHQRRHEPGPDFAARCTRGP